MLVKRENNQSPHLSSKMQFPLLDHLNLYIWIYLVQLELLVLVECTMHIFWLMITLDLLGCVSLLIRMMLLKLLKILQKEFKKKKVFVFLSLEVIMELNLKMNFSKPFIMKMAFHIHFLLLELLNKMGQLKEKIELLWKWLEQCFMSTIYYYNFGQKPLTRFVTFQIEFLKDQF